MKMHIECIGLYASYPTLHTIYSQLHFKKSNSSSHTFDNCQIQGTVGQET